MRFSKQLKGPAWRGVHAPLGKETACSVYPWKQQERCKPSGDAEISRGRRDQPAGPRSPAGGHGRQEPWGAPEALSLPPLPPFFPRGSSPAPLAKAKKIADELKSFSKFMEMSQSARQSSGRAKSWGRGARELWMMEAGQARRERFPVAWKAEP